MVQIAIPYAYGRTICVYAYGTWGPYAYGMKYAYGTQQAHILVFICRVESLANNKLCFITSKHLFESSNSFKLIDSLIKTFLDLRLP